jgi:hypothetical protein
MLSNSVTKRITHGFLATRATRFFGCNSRSKGVLYTMLAFMGARGAFLWYLAMNEATNMLFSHFECRASVWQLVIDIDEKYQGLARAGSSVEAKKTSSMDPLVLHLL